MKKPGLTEFILLLTLLAGLTGCVSHPGKGHGVYNVRQFGAVGDGHHLDSPAINRAIAACGAHGGGTVCVPPGTYLCGSIRLTNNLNFVIEAGATLLGAPQSLHAYDPTEPYTLGGWQDGGHCYFHNSLIWGENLTNVFITGNGFINGGGLVAQDKILDRMVNFDHTDQPQPTNLPPVRLGNKAICLKLCRNALIRDVTIYHGGHFAVLVTGCDNLTVDNVTMDTDRDGIDIDCCRNTAVSNCRINSPNDDALCPKATYALGEVRPTENLTIVNCQVSGFAEGSLLDGTMVPGKRHNGRIKFGTESSGGFRNCTVANCTFRHCSGLALEEVDGAMMENITIENLAMTDVPDYAIYLTTGQRNRTPNLTTPSRARNISISHVIADLAGPMAGMEITGQPGVPVQGVRLEDIRFTSRGGGTADDAARHPRELGTLYPEPGRIGVLPAYGLFVRHARDIEFANIHLNYAKTDFRHAAWFEDVDGLEIDQLKVQTEPGVTPAEYRDVSGLVMRNSPQVNEPARAAGQ